jgi:hypothetical protein
MRELLRLAAEAYHSVELLNNILILHSGLNSKMGIANPEIFLPVGDTGIVLVQNTEINLIKLKSILMTGSNTSTVEIKAGGDTLKSLIAVVNAFFLSDRISSLTDLERSKFLLLKTSCETLRSNLVARGILT